MLKFVKLTEVKEMTQKWPSNTRKYQLDEVVVNSSSITTLRDASHFKKEMKMFKGWPEGLDERIILTEISFNAEEQKIYVVGDFENISKKIGAR